MQILTYPDPMLRKVCRPDFEINGDTIDAMFDLLHEHGGLGLAAPQVGINARFFVTCWGEVFVNPRIVNGAYPIKIMEQCLSLPGESYEKERYSKIKLSTGRILRGVRAVVIQHELEHLNGVLIRGS